MSNVSPVERGTFASAADVLDPARLVRLAGELDVAGDACRVMAGRARGDGARARNLARASACYGAAALLRKISE